MKKRVLSVFIAFAMIVGVVPPNVRVTVDKVYKKPNFHAQNVYSQGEKPTIDEFIAYSDTCRE